MSETITLKHSVHTLPERFEPVYDGSYWSHNGLVTLPVENVNHIRALWFRGYQKTPEGQSLRNFQELDAYIAEVAAQDAAPQTAKSQGETDESDDTGRQSIPTDGLREGESDSSGQTTKRRTRRRRSSGASGKQASGEDAD